MLLSHDSFFEPRTDYFYSINELFYGSPCLTLFSVFVMEPL